MPDIAHEIESLQRLLLPAEFPDAPGYSFAVHYQPCEAAGGDFYGFQVMDNQTLAMGIADVAGHGLKAAVVMAMLRTWIGACRHFNRPMDSIAKELNSFFAEIPDLKTFLTAVFIRLKLSTGQIWVRNCGHPSPRIRRRDSTVVTIDGGRTLPLGIVAEEPEVPEATDYLHPGEALVLFTDGIIESASEDGSFFDDARLDLAILNCAGDTDSIVRSITDAMIRHRGKRRRRDDECIVVVRRA